MSRIDWTPPDPGSQARRLLALNDADGLLQLLPRGTRDQLQSGEHDAKRAYAALRIVNPWPAVTAMDDAIDFAAGWSTRNPVAAALLSDTSRGGGGMFGADAPNDDSPPPTFLRRVLEPRPDSRARTVYDAVNTFVLVETLSIALEGCGVPPYVTYPMRAGLFYASAKRSFRQAEEEGVRIQGRAEMRDHDDAQRTVANEVAQRLAEAEEARRACAAATRSFRENETGSRSRKLPAGRAARRPFSLPDLDAITPPAAPPAAQDQVTAAQDQVLAADWFPPAAPEDAPDQPPAAQDQPPAAQDHVPLADSFPPAAQEQTTNAQEPPAGPPRRGRRGVATQAAPTRVVPTRVSTRNKRR